MSDLRPLEPAHPSRSHSFFMRRTARPSLQGARHDGAKETSMRSTTLALLLALTGTAAADDDVVAVKKTKTIGIDGGIAMPTGGWGDLAGFGIGALARFEMPLQAKLVLTVRAGFLQHLEKTSESMFGGEASSSTSEIPLLGGVRYVFTPKVYGVAELGIVNFRLSQKLGEMSSSGSDTNLGMAL